MSQEYELYFVGTGKTHKIPVEDARDMLAIQAGFDSYEDMRAEGYKLGNDLDI